MVFSYATVNAFLDPKRAEKRWHRIAALRSDEGRETMQRVVSHCHPLQMPVTALDVTRRARAVAGCHQILLPLPNRSPTLPRAACPSSDGWCWETRK